MNRDNGVRGASVGVWYLLTMIVVGAIVAMISL